MAFLKRKLKEFIFIHLRKLSIKQILVIIHILLLASDRKCAKFVSKCFIIYDSLFIKLRKMSNSIETKVTEYVKSTAAITADFNLKNDTLLFEEGLFDSMGFMALINFLQEEMSIQPNDDELVVENFESINAIVNYVSKKQAA